MSSNLKRLALHIRERKLQNYQPYHLLLMPLEQANNSQWGYGLLAWLLQEGYFRTIVTLNRDTSLEDILYGAGIQATILDINKDSIHAIASALDDPPSGICIIKLYHNITSDAQFAGHLPSLPDEIRTSLKIYLQNALVIVGSVLQDSTLAQILRSITIKSVYYVLPQSPSFGDVIHEKTQGVFSIYGLCGEFTPFFTTLVSFLQNGPDVSFPLWLPNRAKMKRQFTMLPKYIPQKEQREPYAEQLPVSPEHPIPILKNKNVFQKKMKTDVLLATVTSIETKAILDLFPHYQEVLIHEKIYFDLGLTNGLHIVLIQQTHMGSSGTAGSHMSIKEAIEALSPLYVIMVGIAFGIDTNKYVIGDILVSRYVQDYDPQRVSTGIDSMPKFENRGERVAASTLLLNRFMAAQYSLQDIWPDNQPKIEFGLILSGSKLVDHRNYRDELRNLAPDAIGGEMEGIGLYHAASDKKIHWIIVKAICDWADGKKDVQKADRQQLAARNAAKFTIYVLQRSSFKHHRYTKKKTADK